MSEGVWGPSVKIVASAIWNYDAQPKEELDSCPLCGAAEFPDSGDHDRYGFYASWTVCDSCGLNFLNPRMTREAYARFYESGAYRALVSAFHGREINAKTLEPGQHAYGQILAHTILAPYFLSRVGFRKGLDIGGSTGVVAAQIANALGMQMTVIDPSPAELERAKGRGLSSILGTIEDHDGHTNTSWDLVTMCQTADHVLDLMGALKKVRGLIGSVGLFWSDIVDFDVTQEVKIDHPYNLTEATYRQFLSRAGFQLLQVNYAPDGVHIGFLCKAAA